MTAATKAKAADVEATGETDAPLLTFVEEPPAPTHLNTLLYGPPGSGKSTAAATSPGPILWVNAEGGNALAFARKIARERDTRILEVRIDPNDQTAPLTVKQTLSEVYRLVRSGGEPQVQTVVVDTVAKLREALAAQIVVPGAKNSIQQWGDVAKALGGFVKAFRDLPVNLVLLCHEEVSDVEGDRIVRPLIGGALSETIPGEVDVMAYCGAHREENEVVYLGQLVEGRGRRAKDRSGSLGSVRPLDLTEWLQAFREGLGTAEALPWDEAPPELDPEDEALSLDLPEVS